MAEETQTSQLFQVGTIGIGLLLFTGGAIVIALEPAGPGTRLDLGLH